MHIEDHYTPWGQPDQVEDHGDGITMYSTPSHGGDHLSEELNDRIPAPLRRLDGWYEEDVEWGIAVMFFPDAPVFRDIGKTREDRVQIAESVIKRYHPDEYTQVTGKPVTPQESHVIARRVARAGHQEYFEVVSAYGDWHEKTPKGMVYVATRRVRDGLPLAFFVPDEEYSPGNYLHPDTDEVAPIEETVRALQKAGIGFARFTIPMASDFSASTLGGNGRQAFTSHTRIRGGRRSFMRRRPGFSRGKRPVTQYPRYGRRAWADDRQW